MNSLYTYVLSNVSSGKIEKQTAVELIKKLKQYENKPDEEIAIIGMAARMPEADNVKEFWHNLRSGKDCVSAFPKNRKEDIDKLYSTPQDDRYAEMGYLSQIDKFDCGFFQISPKEASLMDPNQRLFLETAWSAIEDAGYGGKRITGTRTGVFLGFSSDYVQEYRILINRFQPESLGLATVGNIKSIIASRIAYLLDLHGPTMLVDTACSSVLTAVHLACQGIRKGECEMALVGGVKINLMPLKNEMGIGIESSTSRARTFDDSSDGTGLGEGVGAVLLKPLAKALQDGDQIHGVIKGSAINQDGNSSGVTAPNMLAQVDVIEKAWKNAHIDPQTISYIEAHGTGTKLGDPIEVTGITRAFKKHTTKKQFCGISSVKTNIGHLDCAAGIASLIKVILALKHRELPPTVHFEQPNQKIDFQNSPVYVVDHLQPWETGDTPRRCGISAFGLSGTNCHLILEEAPLPIVKTEETVGSHLFTLSAKTPQALLNLVQQYVKFLHEENSVMLKEVCYSANTGRGHYSHRLALIVNDLEELRQNLGEVYLNGLKTRNDLGIYHAEHRVTTSKVAKREREITEHELFEITKIANNQLHQYIQQPEITSENLYSLVEHYLRGAEIDWQNLYHNQQICRIGLPVYPFEPTRCWIEPTGLSQTDQIHRVTSNVEHPLLDNCVIESMNQDIYLSHFNVDTHWVLGEHRVNGNNLIPGTAYLEMARQAVSKFSPNTPIEIRDAVFIGPLIVKSGETKEVQTIIHKGADELEYTVASKHDTQGTWIKHSTGKISFIEPAKIKYDLSELIQKFDNAQEIDIKSDTYTGSKVLEFGPRWRNLKKLYYSSDQEVEILGYSELNESYHTDLQEYYLHPSLMDTTVNVAIQMLGGLYLPFAYGSLKIYGPMPAKVYSYVRKKEKPDSKLEAVACDVSLLDIEGNVFAEIKDYTVRKVADVQGKFQNYIKDQNSYYQIGWRREDAQLKPMSINTGKTLLFKDEQGIADTLAKLLETSGQELITVEIGTGYQKLAEDHYIITDSVQDYHRLLNEVKDLGIIQILHLGTLAAPSSCTDITDLQHMQNRGIISLFALVKSLVENRYKDIEVVLISNNASLITGQEVFINPLNTAFVQMGKVITQEYPNLQCRAIDIDNSTQVLTLFSELRSMDQVYQVGYRQDQRYVPELRDLNLSEVKDREISLKEEGIYLITGGLGGIGLEIGEYLAQKCQIKLALTARTQLPPREEWSEILQNTQDKQLSAKIRGIQKIEALGTQVEVYATDVTDLAQMENLVNHLRQRYGRINGVIHSAGIAGDGFIFLKEETAFTQVLSPKIQGTWIIDHLTAEDKLDFFILFSSITSITGGKGQSDYTAANAYLDGFASLGRLQGKPILTINWPAWKETGMAVAYGVNDDRGFLKAITTEDALRGFAEVINKEIANVIIGDLNIELLSKVQELPIRLSSHITQRIGKRSKQLKGEEVQPKFKSKDTKTVVLKGHDEENASDIMLKVAQIWAKTLGMEEVDIYDNFNDMGGDSILATHLLSELEKEFPGVIDISDIFTYSTIDEMTQYIDQKINPITQPTLNRAPVRAKANKFDQILDQLTKGEISVSDAEKMTLRGKK